MSRPPCDLTLYLVTDTEMCRRRGVAETVRLAVDGGVSIVQLRDHAASDDELVALGRELIDVLAGTGVPLIIDDRVHLVEAIGAHGAHVGQRDMAPSDAREVLGEARLLGLSVSTSAQVQAANDLPAGTVDYLGIGPVWATATKADHGPTLGPAGAAGLASLTDLPSVAIAGIDATRAGELVGTGIDGIAVVSAICAAEDPRSAATELRNGWRSS